MIFIDLKSPRKKWQFFRGSFRIINHIPASGYIKFRKNTYTFCSIQQQQKKESMFRTKMWFLEIMEMYKDPRNTDRHIKTENTK